MNNADYGLSLQKLICNVYGLEINENANKQFNSNFNPNYNQELLAIIPIIFEKIGEPPQNLLTYSKELMNQRQTTSPHNFLLKSGKTLSIRTTKTSDKVAPRTVGQAGFAVLNDYFSDIFGRFIENQEDIKELVYNYIHKMLPIFIDHLFQSDYTILINRYDAANMKLIRLDELDTFTFERRDFTFTKNLHNWRESTTLKYKGTSIAEVQTHKERSFKFRFIISNIPEWFRIIKENNETFGMSAESAICDYFKLEEPGHFGTRTSIGIKKQLYPVIKEAFSCMPKPIMHSGSTLGDRGYQSKCSYDFILEGNLTMSLKTNKGKMVCPPEVGQPGASTCWLYFKELLDDSIYEINAGIFKTMVYNKIDKMIPIYVKHLFDSDWLLWIYAENDKLSHIAISKNDVEDFVWEKNNFSFTKTALEEWKESNTVKYNGITLGEFQVHNNRNSYKFRFQMSNLLKMILIKNNY